jgi:hypothetical protein
VVKKVKKRGRFYCREVVRGGEKKYLYLCGKGREDGQEI